MILYNNAYEIMTCTLCQSFSKTCFVAGSVNKMHYVLSTMLSQVVNACS